MHLRIPRHLLSGNWTEAVTTMKHKVKDIHNDIVTINYSKLVTSDTEPSIYNTKISQPQPILSTIQITTAPTNTTTQISLARNMISAFTINAGNLLNQSHHNIMVAVLLGIFMCITLTITIAIFVFCRKKNSVFMLQKCEQDSDLEMTDMNTEVETSDSEYEVIESSETPDNTRRSLTCPELNLYASRVNIAEENHTEQDRHSKNRSSNHRNRHRHSESPTSTPLLNSKSDTLFQTGSSLKSVQHYSPNSTTKHSQSLDYVSEISGAKSKTREKFKKNKSSEETGGSYQERHETHQDKTSVKRKQKLKSAQNSNSRQNGRKGDTLEQQDIFNKKKHHNSKHTSRDANTSKTETRKSQILNDTYKESKPQTDSSILKMVSVDDEDSDLTEQSGLLEDNSDVDIQDMNGMHEVM